MKISILTGPVHSGKTTFLQKFIAEKKYVAGIISPVMNDTRFFQNILTEEIQSMETSSEDPAALHIGKFYFSQTAFDWAINVIENATTNQADIIIIDEIGPLELQDNGFAKLLKNILLKDNFDGELILVIRDKILEEVILFFNLNKEKINFIKWKYPN